jgi:hypothetical protein
MRTLTRGLAAVTAVAAVVLASCGHPSPSSGAPLRQVGQIPLPGDGSRFDYASPDAQRGLLFLAHLGASRVIEVDVHTHQVVRTIGGLSQVHGVLVVPERRWVYATATGTNQMVALDEDTGAELGRAPTGDYPDGLAYDPLHATVWTTNESGGSETVVDATTHQVLGTGALGGEAGNVAYDSGGQMMLVDVQSRNSLAVIDPATLTIVRQVPLPGCEHDHGLAVDRSTGWRSSPATETPCCSPSTSTRGRSPGPTWSARTPMRWPTTLSPIAFTSPPKAAGSPHWTSTIGAWPS